MSPRLWYNTQQTSLIIYNHQRTESYTYKQQVAFSTVANNLYFLHSRRPITWFRISGNTSLFVKFQISCNIILFGKGLYLPFSSSQGSLFLFLSISPLFMHSSKLVSPLSTHVTTNLKQRKYYSP